MEVGFRFQFAQVISTAPIGSQHAAQRTIADDVIEQVSSLSLQNTLSVPVVGARELIGVGDVMTTGML